MEKSNLIDRFKRSITYLRLSVTDRCDFRCTYCMAESMAFLPRKEVLSLEEIVRIGRIFTELGVSKIRITGGEPLIRNNIIRAIEGLGSLPGLSHLCLTTNGSRLSEMAQPLKEAGVSTLNISLDSLDKERFKHITRHGDLNQVLRGIERAQQCGFSKIKINSVILRSKNLDEVPALVDFAMQRGLDISFIEEMPLGVISTHDRAKEFVSSEELRALIGRHYPLTATLQTTGGPSRYWQISGSNNTIGFISPHSDNFCASCNRVRLTASGRLLLCLGNEHSIDLRHLLRLGCHDDQIKRAIIQSMDIKPEKHEFDLHAKPEIVRFMSATGG